MVSAAIAGAARRRSTRALAGMESLRSEVEASAGFALGTALAFGGHLLVLAMRPSDLKLGWGALDSFILFAGLAACAMIFLSALVAFRSLSGGRRLRSSVKIAVAYGALTYLVTFFVLLAVFHLAEEPSPNLSLATLALMVFLLGVLFAALLTRPQANAS